jgi:hypothetical protein
MELFQLVERKPKLADKLGGFADGSRAAGVLELADRSRAADKVELSNRSRVAGKVELANRSRAAGKVKLAPLTRLELLNASQGLLATYFLESFV